MIIIRMKTISAAERKRQIRERRRLKQNQASSSSLPTATADDEGVIRRNDAVTSGVENNNNLTNQNVECSILPNNSKVAHNNDISGAVGESSSATKECQSTSSKTTLFSVVMSRSINRDSPSENNNSDAIISNKNIATTPKATTPNTRQENDREKQLFSPTKSPGGYDVLKALDVANVYNEHLLKIENDESGSNQSENDDVEPEDDWMDAHVISRQTRLSSDVTSPQSSTVKENLLDGMEAEIIEETRHMIDHSDLKRIRPLVYDEPIGVGVVDWSLKKRLRIESVPGRCLPGNMSSSQLFAKVGQNTHKQPLNDGYVHQLAMQYLSNPLMNHRREGSTAECLEARWKASTMYYQHPSVYPLPPSILQDLPKAAQNMTQCDNGDLSSFIRGPRSIYHRLRLSGCGSLGGLGESASHNGEKTKPNDGSMVSYISDTSKMLEQRRCEWREAFRSVFNSWRTRLRQLEGRRNSNDSAGSGRLSSLDNEECKLPTTEEVLRSSFYSIRPEQVVLFRGGYVPVNVDGNVEHCIMPIIVFSSTTVQLRSMLSSMGIKMRVLREKGNGIEFFSEENLKDIDAQVQANAVSGDTESVHAELEAIKWAENGNGNVTVAQKNKRRRLDDKTFTSPLYCVGYNDCSALFELFLNTCGLSVSSGSNPFEDRFDSEIQSDVPLLLCRSLGSCMHFTLKTLCVSGLRDYGYMNQMKEKQETTDVRTTMELRGPILPCSLRDITCSLVDRMMLDKLQTRSVSKQPFESSTIDDGVGTHHFAMFVQPHEGERATLGPKSTGISSSSLFNGSKIILGQNDSSNWHECSHRELLNVIVWDSHRPNHVSYNSKHLPFSAR